MKYDRIEVRLDEEHVKKLAELKAAYGTSASEVVRRAIDEAWWEAEKERRLKIVEAMAQANTEEMPDPEELNRQLNDRYGDLS